MKFKLRNPIAFTPLPVTIITSLVYVALIVSLLLVHLVVPPAPTSPTPAAGINLTEAWLDLRLSTQTYHPYNSRPNDQVRDWLLHRLEGILSSNAIAARAQDAEYGSALEDDDSPAVVFSDVTSNVSFSSSTSDGKPGTSVYFESTNIIVYIRGSDEDEEGSWWFKNAVPKKGGVLVNAHYDSVSTGFGATDDGVGVITILQLVKHFTSKGKQPKRGIVALLNNGEEDYLNGARAFSQHPMSRFTHTFLNLEGAGAGGRAALFRSTDTDITKAYKGARHPLGNCGSGDAFKRGVIRSQTDYVIFNGLLGLRGLDVAFLDPRARYHTNQDDTRHTSVASLWHMLSASLTTLETLSSDTSSTFDGKPNGKGKVPSGKGTTGVWFDLLGESFAVLQLRTLFALSITLLVVGPIVLLLLGVILSKVDKFYLFSSSKHHHHQEGDDSVPLQGLRGMTRFPVVSLVASAAAIALAVLVARVNPYVVYSSPYAVWSMMLSAWLSVAWFLSRTFDYFRPTALHRTYSLLWMFLVDWVILVIVTVYEQRLKLAGDYFLVIYFAAVFLATAISFLELFGLQRKTIYADGLAAHEYGETPGSRPRSSSSSKLLAPSTDERPSQDPMDAAEDDEDREEPADESTSLLRGSKRATFARKTSPHQNPSEENTGPPDEKQARVFGFEQAWSWSLPTWTWLLQFLLLAVVPVILVGQIGLLLVTGTYQTLADGNPPLPVYLSIAVFSVLILAPLTPYLHRYTYHIPTFLFLALIGTLIYNIVAFPFSTNNRLKLFFQQKVDLDTGINQVLLTGIGDPYLAEAINSLPSTAGQSRKCTPSTIRKGLTECAWHGIPPEVVQRPPPELPPHHRYSEWLTYHIFRAPNTTEARIRLWGRNTRACKIEFSQPISDFTVDGAGSDKRFQRVPEEGSKEVRLWSRTWEKEWTVRVKWQPQPGSGDGIDGRVVCLWSDDNEMGVIPALDEIRHFAPDWIAITKTGDGLVEGSKAFLV